MSRDKTSNDRSPMCPICETRHWAREPHDFKRKSAKLPAKKKWQR